MIDTNIVPRRKLIGESTKGLGGGRKIKLAHESYGRVVARDDVDRDPGRNARRRCSILLVNMAPSPPRTHTD